MNLSELVSTFLARGFDYMSTGEAELLINDAYQIDIVSAENWPFLETQQETTAPVPIENVESIEFVVDVTVGQKLSPLDPRNLTDAYPLRQETGTPRFYYLTEGVLNVYPVNTTDKLLVRYRAFPPQLTGTATPVIPTRFHSLIVDGAVARAYEGSDDYELAQSAANVFGQRLQRMREVLLEPYRDGPSQFIQMTNTDLSSGYWR